MIEFKKALPNSIEIVPSDNGGYIVRCGCATMIYTQDETSKLIDDLDLYLVDPKAVEELYKRSRRNAGGRIAPDCERAQPVGLAEEPALTQNDGGGTDGPG